MKNIYYNPFGSSDNQSSNQAFDYNANMQNCNVPEYSNNLNNNFEYNTNTLIEMEKMRKRQGKDIMKIGFILGTGILLCLLISSVFSIMLDALNLTNAYKTDPVFSSAFNAVAVSICSIALPFGVLALLNKKKFITPIIPSKRIGFLNCLKWVCFGMFTTIVANLGVSLIITFMEQVGYKMESPEFPKLDSVFGCVMLIISTMIMPAVCEEFAMRCCALGLLRKHGKAFCVLAVSIIFGLLHGNAVQFLFAFCVGAILAYITIKTDSIIPAVLIHAFSNGRSVFYDIAEYGFGEQFAEKAISIITIVWIILGALSLVLMLIKGDFKVVKEQKQSYDVLSLGKKVAYLLPGLAIPLLILVYGTMMTIKKM